MPDSGLATAADYSEALGVLRRAKSLLVLLLALMLVGQITLFLLIKYNVVSVTSPAPDLSSGKFPGAQAFLTVPSTQPVNPRWVDVMHYLTGLTLLGGVALSIVCAAVLILITHVMLVGRLIGVGKVSSSIVWMMVLVVFLFPWQTFMNNADLSITDFRVPGVLWTWGEMIQRVHAPDLFDADHWPETVLRWFRFVIAPFIALVLTLLVQMRSNRGLRMAMGEDPILNEMMGNA